MIFHNRAQYFEPEPATWNALVNISSMNIYISVSRSLFVISCIPEGTRTHLAGTPGIFVKYKKIYILHPNFNFDSCFLEI